MTNKLKWLLLGPCLAVLLVFGPSLAGTGSAAQKGVQPPAESGTPPLQVVISLCGVLALAAATLLVWRRLGGPTLARRPAAERQLKIHETLRLSPRNRVHLVSVSGRMLLLGEGDKGVEILHRVTAVAEPVAPAAEPLAIGPAAIAAFAADATARAGDAEDEEDLGAEPRDMVIEPAPRRGKPAASTVGDFRKLLEKVRAEVAS